MDNLALAAQISGIAYNAHPDCTDTPEREAYGRGIVVGQISTIMAHYDLLFADAVRYYAQCIRKAPLCEECVPESWRDVFKKEGLL